MAGSRFYLDRNHPDLLSKLLGAPLTAASLRKSVLRNLHRLCNSRTGMSEQEQAQFPEAQGSVLNFGVRDFSSGRISADDYATHLAWAVRTFEPRLSHESVTVQYIKPPGGAPLQRWFFRISGDLWSARHGCTAFHCHLEIDVDGRARIIA